VAHCKASCRDLPGLIKKNSHLRCDCVPKQADTGKGSYVIVVITVGGISIATEAVVAEGMAPSVLQIGVGVEWRLVAAVVVDRDAMTPCISNNSSFRLKHPGVPDGSDGSDGTSYPLTENYTLL